MRETKGRESLPQSPLEGVVPGKLFMLLSQPKHGKELGPSLPYTPERQWVVYDRLRVGASCPFWEVAEFIRLCSASNLAGARCISSPLQD